MSAVTSDQWQRLIDDLHALADLAEQATRRRPRGSRGKGRGKGARDHQPQPEGKTDGR